MYHKTMTSTPKKEYPVYPNSLKGKTLLLEPKPIDYVKATDQPTAEKLARDKHGSDAFVYHRKLKSGDALL